MVVRTISPRCDRTVSINSTAFCNSLNSRTNLSPGEQNVLKLILKNIQAIVLVKIMSEKVFCSHTFKRLIFFYFSMTFNFSLCSPEAFLQHKMVGYFLRDLYPGACCSDIKAKVHDAKLCRKVLSHLHYKSVLTKNY